MIDFGCLVQASPVRNNGVLGHIGTYFIFLIRLLLICHKGCSLHRCQGMLPKSEIALLAIVLQLVHVQVIRSRGSWHR